MNRKASVVYVHMTRDWAIKAVNLKYFILKQISVVLEML